MHGFLSIHTFFMAQLRTTSASLNRRQLPMKSSSLQGCQCARFYHCAAPGICHPSGRTRRPAEWRPGAAHRDRPSISQECSISHSGRANRPSGFHSEALIQEALFGLMHGRTVLIIAHRLRLASQADQIAVTRSG